MPTRYDVIIVGAGIAGLTSALYCSRQKLKTLIVSKDLGGQLLMTPEIQNFPGFTSISGFDLVRRVERQVKLYGADIVYDEVTKVRGEKGHFYVETVTSNLFEAYSVILAFGKVPRDLNVPGENRLRGRGISYCVICDAPLFRGKVTALVGWGQHCLDAASLLRDYSSKVYWIFPGKRPVSDEESLKNVISEGKVVLVPDSVPVEVRGEERVKSILVENRKTRRTSELKVDGVFVEMGYVTKTDFVKDLVELNEKGEIIIDDRCRTSREGVFAAGDVTSQMFKQAVISAAQGAVAALSAYNYVMRVKGREVSIRRDWRKISMGKGDSAGFSVFTS